MRIFLIGYMGSGKTTIGKQLASRLGYRFVDQDHVIEEEYGMKVSEIFTNLGENTFREAENRFLKNLSEDNLVISTGGGAPCFFDNIDIMNRSGRTVYLKASPSVLAHRLKYSTGTRPILAGKSGEELLQFIAEKLTEREPFYNRAQYYVEAANLKVEDILPLLRNE
ncbi:MAG: shikimate kinase [Bacteroidota bacterium]|nr:shikimate kinase [Bacteroidota bacterium]